MADDSKKSAKVPGKVQAADQTVGVGVINYRLSDREFIDKGWTMLPVEKVVRKVNIYRMQPACPEFDWFERNKNKGVMTYDTGEKLAEFDEKGRGRWYYRNGRLALNYYDAAEINAQQRFVLYSSGEPDERGRSRPVTVLGLFDYIGNGVIFDHSGKVRLKYNQMEGVILDKGVGPHSHWKWHTLNDPPVLQRVMIDTHMEQKDPTILNLGTKIDIKKAPRQVHEDMVAIEFDNFVKDQKKRLGQKFNSYQIKMKALKVNEYFSLRILDQTKIYLLYHDGSTTLKLNLGMILNSEEIVDVDTAEMGKVVTPLDRFPARSGSVASIQKSIEYAQRFERARSMRERMLRPMVEPNAKEDQLAANLSRPLRPAVQAAISDTSTATEATAERCKRKKCPLNLYYDTRIGAFS